MGSLRLIYDETTREFKKVNWWGELNVKGTRKAMQGPLRYCLQGNKLFLPEDHRIIEKKHRICWGRIRMEEFEEYDWLKDFAFDKTISVDPLDYHMPFTGIGFGVLYSQRHAEENERRIPVKEFIGQEIIDAIAKNPEALLDISKSDFERLMAELFARMGFHVDLYRTSKDDGIDFLAVDIGQGDPIIKAVQCKHPNKPAAGKKARTLPAATVREIYGVAKANNLAGAIAITSSTYSPDAKRFADLRPDEIQVKNAEDICRWIRNYRWSKDE